MDGLAVLLVVLTIGQALHGEELLYVLVTARYLTGVLSAVAEQAVSDEEEGEQAHSRQHTDENVEHGPGDGRVGSDDVDGARLVFSHDRSFLGDGGLGRVDAGLWLGGVTWVDGSGCWLAGDGGGLFLGDGIGGLLLGGVTWVDGSGCRTTRDVGVTWVDGSGCRSTRDGLRRVLLAVLGWW